MNPRRLPIGVLMIVPIVLGFGLYAFTGSAQQVEDPNATPTATADGLADARRSVDEAYQGYYATQTAAAGAPALSPEDQYATYAAGQPTATPPVSSHGAFHEDAWVRVNAGAGDCLNARNAPTLQNDYVIVNICIPDGYEGAITGSAQEADGHWWWHLAGLGWVAEDYLAYLRDFDARTNVATELSAAAGKVAFLRGNDIWMMRPDGSGQTLLVDNVENDPQAGTYVPGPVDLTWSPDGTRLSFNIYRSDGDGVNPGSVDLHVLTLDDSALAASQVFEGLAGGAWSPDGAHLGVVREPTPPQMGGGIEGIPAILDVTTGGQLVLGSERMYQQKAPAFNFDGSLLMVNEAIYSQDGANNRVSIVIYTSDGADYDRIDFSSESNGYASPSWSPDSNRIAMHVSRDQRARYQVYDLATRTFAGNAEPPSISERIGGGCGGGDMWNTEWSTDGMRVLYSFTWGDTGANGIWSWDLRDGSQNILYAANAGAPTAGPGSLILFSTNDYPASHIFYGSSNGGFPRIITDGSSPVWYVPE